MGGERARLSPPSRQQVVDVAEIAPRNRSTTFIRTFIGYGRGAARRGAARRRAAVE